MPNKVAALLLCLSGMRVVNVRRRCTGDQANVTQECLDTRATKRRSDCCQGKLIGDNGHSVGGGVYAPSGPDTCTGESQPVFNARCRCPTTLLLAAIEKSRACLAASEWGNAAARALAVGHLERVMEAYVPGLSYVKVLTKTDTAAAVPVRQYSGSNRHICRALKRTSGACQRDSHDDSAPRHIFIAERSRYSMRATNALRASSSMARHLHASTEQADTTRAERCARTDVGHWHSARRCVWSFSLH